MYTKEQLAKYPYFAKLLEKNQLSVILDALTGIVSRGYILGFARSLIADNIPFTFAILDLDNFKFINDTYGHQVGDGVLVHVAKSLIWYLDGYGVAGRFGGDEMLIINFRDITAEEKKSFLNRFYEDDGVMRKNIPLQDCQPFVTGTIGCATYPTDAQDYDVLFGLVDKTLYRGKSKGRNCYVYYREDMHKNLEIRKIAKHGMYTSLHDLAEQFESRESLLEGMRAATRVLKDQIGISELYYADKKGIMHAEGNAELEEIINDIGALMDEDIYSANSFRRIEYVSPIFYEVLKRRQVETVLIVRIGSKASTYGYLICAEPRSLRIWQEDESAVLYFLAKLIEHRIQATGEEL